MTLRWILFGKVGTLKGRFATALGVWCKANEDSFSGSTTYEFIPARESHFAAVEERAKDTDFAVTGTPRRVPWHIRKRELEAAAKTKRKKLESFQEYV